MSTSIMMYGGPPLRTDEPWQQKPIVITQIGPVQFQPMAQLVVADLSTLSAKIDRLEQAVAALTAEMRKPRAPRPPGPASRYTPAQMEEMRVMKASGKSLREIGKHFRCAHTYVHQCLNGKAGRL